jgi:hypothetical protein
MVNDNNQTTKSLTERERVALADIKVAPMFYARKQSSMRKLKRHGLVREVGLRGGKVVWELTDEGKAHGCTGRTACVSPDPSDGMAGWRRADRIGQGVKCIRENKS